MNPSTPPKKEGWILLLTFKYLNTMAEKTRYSDAELEEFRGTSCYVEY